MSKDFQEKPSISHVEHVDSKQHSLNDLHGHNTVDLTEDHGDEHDPVFVKKTIRKIDIRLLIILGAMYSISLIDRTNLSSARLGGMATELKLTVGERYSIATLAFFPPYIIFEFPSNLLLRKVGARNLLSTITLLWGAVTLAIGFVTNWHQLVALRVLLGLLEGGFFPACVYLISCWYTRWQTQTRLSLFYLMSMMLSGFSQILAYGLINIPRAGKVYTWRWIFVVLGAITMLLGVIAIFTIIDFPDKNTFLTGEETELIMQRLNRDRGDAVPDKMSGKKALRHVTDWRTWAYGLCFMSSTLPSYAFAYFLPIILAGQGFSTLKALCLSAPPYAAAAIYTFCIAISSDKLRQRGLFVCVNAVVCLIGCAIIGYHRNPDVRYFGAFLAIMGAQANVPSVLAYQANNTVTHSKKSVASAVVIGMGGVGGIFASTVYRQADYPRYIPGLWATIGAQLLIIVLVATLTLFNKRQNKLLDAGRREPIEGIVGFRYSI